MAQEFEANPLTDADGCVELLYNFLWRKNAAGTSCPGLNLPDTVVYKYRQAAFWFFSSTKERGALRRKNKANVVNKNVFETFTKRKAGHNSDIVAYHIHSTEHDAHASHGPHVTKRDFTEVEYFDDDGLKHFLFHGDKSNNGVLQRWVEPKGTRASTIRAAWSPQLCLLERRVARKPLSDRRAEPALRASTFDGEEHLSDASPLTGTTLAARVQSQCNAIVEHVYESSGRKFRISRMCAHFRIDSQGKLWFLWCSSLRLACGEWTARPVLPVNLDPNFALKRRSRYLVPPRQKDLDKANKTEEDPIPEIMHNLRSDWFLCCYTGKLHPVADRVEVSYKFVILDHEAMAVDEEEARSIPPALKHAEPTLEQEEYDALKLDPTFLYKTCAMCTEGSLALNDSILERLSKENPASMHEPSWAPLPGGPPPRDTTAAAPLPPLAYPFTYDHNVIASGVYHIRDAQLPSASTARPSTQSGSSLYPGAPKPKVNYALAASHPRIFNNWANASIGVGDATPLSPLPSPEKARRPATSQTERARTAPHRAYRPHLAGGALPLRVASRSLAERLGYAAEPEGHFPPGPAEDTAEPEAEPEPEPEPEPEAGEDAPPSGPEAGSDEPPVAAGADADADADADAAEADAEAAAGEAGAAAADGAASAEAELAPEAPLFPRSRLARPVVARPRPYSQRSEGPTIEYVQSDAAAVLNRYNAAIAQELEMAGKRHEKLDGIARTYRKNENLPPPPHLAQRKQVVREAAATARISPAPKFQPVKITFGSGKPPARRYYAPQGDEASILNSALNKDEFGILHRVNKAASEPSETDGSLNDAEQAYLARILEGRSQASQSDA